MSVRTQEIAEDTIGGLMRSGGYTVNVHDSVPKSGWMVSIAGHEKAVPQGRSGHAHLDPVLHEGPQEGSGTQETATSAGGWTVRPTRRFSM